MKKTSLVCVVLFAAACGKKAEEKKAPEPTTKTVEQTQKEPVAPAKLTLTSKSPEAVKEFEAGQALAIAARGDEALPHFKKALELDPEFARAMAAVALNTPGPEGSDMLAKAGTLAEKLPDGEKSVIEGQIAMRAGDPVKARERFEHALSVAPGEWWLDLTLAEISNGRDDAAALKYSEDAIKLNPTAAQPYNIMAYTYARQKEWDKAITAAKKQVELAPTEPNPLDSLAEIEMWSGKFDDADKHFVKATTVEPKFTLAWQGAELARAYKGDFKGAYEANDKYAAGTAPGQKFDALLDKAWLQFAEGKLPDALKSIDAVEKDAAAQKLPVYAWAGLDRVAILATAGKLADAKKVHADIVKRSEQLTGDGRYAFMQNYRLQALRLAMLEGKPAPDADKLLADQVTDGKRLGDDKNEAGLEAYMHGLIAWAKGGAKDGPKAAIDDLAKCPADLLICQWDLAQAKRKSGDAAGADAVAKTIAETPRREAGAVYVLKHASDK